MNDGNRIQHLLENLIDSDGTPESVCVDDPELLPAVRERWELFRRIDSELNALFAPSQPAGGADRSSAAFGPEELPEIPGYELHGVLGRGGVGVVYRARHLGLDRPVAIKMLIAGSFAGPAERAKLLREARAVAKLRHPNIVQVYDVGEVHGRPYFTMELIDGKTLGEQIDGTPQPAARAAALLLNLAAAVEFSHKAGIVHRDLKPSNILFSLDGTSPGTSAGTPKIADFGLARQSFQQESLTPEQMGTPSYMAPELCTASGSSAEPTADVYSLGAILYETLTGRPPFRGESPPETLRQVLSQEPVRPSRFNAPLPRDLETICLTCLRKDSCRRYASAGALAEDLRRYLHGEPILARPTGRIERSVKWIGRHTAIATAAGSALLAVVIFVAAATWWKAQTASRTRNVADDLAQAARLQHQGFWKEADAALDRATLRLGDHGPASLRESLAKVRRESDLDHRLDAIAAEEPDSTDGFLNLHKSSQDYQEAFGNAGILPASESVESAAAKISESNISGRLIDAMYDWTFVTEPKLRPRLWQVVCRADTDPTGWREKLRSPAVWNDPEKLADAAAELPVADQPVAFCLAVRHQLESSGRDPMPFLFRLQDAQPQDFWADLNLADALRERHRPAEAIGYYGAAVAVRPTVAIARHNLGMALADAGDRPRAIAQFTRAVELDPGAAASWASLANLFCSAGQFADAIRAARECLKRSPANYGARIILAVTLERLGDHQKAADEYAEGVRLTPKNSDLKYFYRNCLLQLGRNQEALEVWKDFIRLDPSRTERWEGYAEFCFFLGRLDDYRTARMQMLQRFGNSDDPHVCERCGRACLLMPADSSEQLSSITAVVDRALDLDLAKPTGARNYFKVSKALADYRNGNFTGAIGVLSGGPMKVLGPAPRLIRAMAEFRLGQIPIAKTDLKQAVAGFDWSNTSDRFAFWIYDALRAEAQLAAGRPSKETVPLLPAW
jgi:tetratricopeptide (TPR) repeat protein